jgi:hypothetical protein
MSATGPAVSRTSEFLRLLDAKDAAGMRARTSDDVQSADELTRRWLRGRSALEAYLSDNLPHLTDIRSTIDHVGVRAWGDIQVEICMLHQSYIFDGARVQIVAPTSAIWHRQGDAWKLVPLHSIALSTAP